MILYIYPDRLIHHPPTTEQFSLHIHPVISTDFFDVTEIPGTVTFQLAVTSFGAG